MYRSSQFKEGLPAINESQVGKRRMKIELEPEEGNPEGVV